QRHRLPGLRPGLLAVPSLAGLQHRGRGPGDWRRAHGHRHGPRAQATRQQSRMRLLRLPAALLIAGLLVAVDAESKSWATSDLRRRGARTVIENHLVLRFQLNSGIAFGLFTDSLDRKKGPILIAYSAVMTAGLGLLLALRLLRRAQPGWLVPGGL